ncbi:MAG: response regulator [Spirochaetia bacterium]|nr:response regulator [Spirochaetia bacterium]
MKKTAAKSLILIVDDVPANIQLLGNFLRKANYNLAVAQNGLEALSIVDKKHPELILLDVMMPEMNGYETITKLKENSETKNIPIIFLTAKGDTEDVVKAFELGAVDYIMKPFQPQELLSRVKTQIELRRLQSNLENEVKIRTNEVKKAHEKLVESHIEVINRLTLAAEFRDKETGNHVKRISYYSMELGMAYGLNNEECGNLFVASGMHDVGKIGIPDHILLKEDKLTSEEREIMKSHTTIGAQILSGSNSKLLQMAETIALTHHEKYDGTGYPENLAGDKIPIEGRIVAISDVFDALTSERPYKKAWPVDNAVSYLLEEKNGHFDGHLVDLFIDKLPSMSAIFKKFKG